MQTAGDTSGPSWGNFPHILSTTTKKISITWPSWWHLVHQLLNWKPFIILIKRLSKTLIMLWFCDQYFICGRWWGHAYIKYMGWISSTQQRLRTSYWFCITILYWPKKCWLSKSCGCSISWITRRHSTVTPWYT